MGHLLQPIQSPDVVQRVDAGTEAAVQTEDLAVHQRRQGQVVEQIREVLPHVGVSVLAETLVVESVHLTGGGAVSDPGPHTRSPDVCQTKMFRVETQTRQTYWRSENGEGQLMIWVLNFTKKRGNL